MESEDVLQKPQIPEFLQTHKGEQVVKREVVLVKEEPPAPQCC